MTMSVYLSKLITEDNIVFLNTKEMKETVTELSSRAFEMKKINEKSDFLDAILERESLVSTGIGLGIAIPHVKLSGIDDFFIVVGINNDGIDWDAIDRMPVSAVFLIGGPDNNQKKYLQIIAKLMLLVKNSDRREKLLAAKEAIDVVKLFEKF
jgi:PTS system nitrogen regulatory IIA component